MTDPWFKFYPSDWRSDPKLKMCSLPARGLWIEMISIMHESEPYGYLKISGISPTPMQLAMQVGAMPDDVEKCLSELENAKVFSRNRAKVIFSRRMIKDAKRRDNARINGSKGGNPSLGKTTTKSSSVNPTSKGEVKAQKPEARGQRPDKKKVTKVTTKKIGTRLSEDWFLPKEYGEWAVSQGMAREQVRFEADKFKDFWISKAGKDASKLDWLATWRNWIRNNKSNGNQQSKPGGGSFRDQLRRERAGQ